MAEPDEPNEPGKLAPLGDILTPKPKVNIAVQHDTADETPVPTEAPESDEPEVDDEAADQAVDDIMKKDSDAVLQAEDKAADKNIVMKQGRGERLKNFLARWWAEPRKRYSTIAVVVLLLAALFGVPYTRYNILGLVLQAPVTIRVVDSKSGAAVSGATVKLGNKTALTDVKGSAIIRVHGGNRTLTVSKSYYTGYTKTELVPVPGGSTFSMPLIALGRQVKVKVLNKISGKPVAGASLTAGGASTKTDASGLATLIVPSGADTQSAEVSLSGYNTAKVTLVAAGNLAKNSFSLTPAGKLYFLSNLSGSIDVVKTNLDGTDRQTVLAGTGNEDPQNTSLLASRDWKYLALLSKRSGDNASVYLIDTTNGDKLTTIDEGDADFSFVGWSGDRFIYQVTRHAVQAWQPNQSALKSLNASTGQTLLLDQTQGSGSNSSSFARQAFTSPYIIDDQVVYGKNWQGQGSGVLDGKQAELDTIGADGSGHKTIKSFAPTTYPESPYYTSIGIDSKAYEPDGLYIQFSAANQDDFYDYDAGKIAPDTTLTDDTFYGNTPYPTYLLSPSGSSTFWSEPRDGKNTLFTGDQDGKSPKQIASLSDYNTYGWYTDDYLLVSKSSSELYIMPATGGTPFKITDYYKPAINYQGYGGGYGGL